jgi:hypothetical protein
MQNKYCKYKEISGFRKTAENAGKGGRAFGTKKSAVQICPARKLFTVSSPCGFREYTSLQNKNLSVKSQYFDNKTEIDLMYQK